MSRFLTAALQTTLSGGVGALELDPAPAGFRSAVDAGIGADQAFFVIRGVPGGADAGRWEVVHSTVTEGQNGAPDWLERETTVESSNNGQPVNWTAGAQKIVYSSVTAGPMNGLLGTFLGPVRPADLLPGGLWTSNAADPVWVLYQFVGTADIPLLRVDTANGLVLDTIAEPADPADVGKAYVAGAGGTHGWGQLGAAGLQDGAVATDKLADGSVQTAKVGDRTITRPKIGLDAVGPDEIEDGTVDSGHLNAGDALNMRTVLGAEATGSAAAVQANLDGHEGDTENPHAVTAAQAGAVAKGGDTMTGLLTLSGAPTANLHAATKQYVDEATATGAGAEVQAGQTLKTDTFSASVAAGTWQDITGLSITLNGVAAANKLLIDFSLSIGADAARRIWFRIVRNGTPIAAAAAAGSRQQGLGGAFPDSASGQVQHGGQIEDTPGAGNHTYKLQWAHEEASAVTLHLNRSNNDPDSNRALRGASRIAAREFAQ